MSAYAAMMQWSNATVTILLVTVPLMNVLPQSRDVEDVGRLMPALSLWWMLAGNVTSESGVSA